MAQQRFDEDQVSTSKFYMFRCLAAIAHADGIVCDEERAYLMALITHNPFSDEQKATLLNDLDQAQKIENLLPYINDPVYRGQIAYFARIMAFKDGNLDPSEEDILNKLEAYSIEGVDLDALQGDIKKAVDAKLFEYDIKVENSRPKKGDHFVSWFYLLDQLLMRLGIDLMK